MFGRIRTTQPPAATKDPPRVGVKARGEHVWLVIGFSVLLGLMALQTALSLRQIESQRQQLKTVIELGLNKFNLVGEMHAAGRERILLLQRMFLVSDPFEREALRADFGRQAELFIRARQNLLAMTLRADEKALLERQSALSQRFHHLHLEALELLDRGETGQAMRLLNERVLPTQYAVLSTLTELYDLQQRDARDIGARSDRLQQEARRLLLAVALLLLLTGLTVAYFPESVSISTNPV